MCFCSAEGHSGDGYYMHRFSLDYNGACVCFQLCQGMTSCSEESCSLGAIVFVILSCFLLLRYLLTMVVCMFFMFVHGVDLSVVLYVV